MEKRLKLYQALIVGILAFIGSALGTYFSTYFGPYMQQNSIARTQLANDLADYYSSAATEYYANQDLNNARREGWDENSQYFIEAWKNENLAYTKFLIASTKLEAEVPPTLRDKVISIEDDFDKLPLTTNINSETQWFKDLDGIRDQVIKETVFNKKLELIWKK